MRHPAFRGHGSLAGGEELLSIEMLEEHARRLAALLSIAPRRRGGGRAHLRQLKGHMRALRDVYSALAADARQEAMSPAAEWLLDNFHIISAAARDIHHDLPPSFFRRLPHVATDEFAGLPRIYALALELIRSSAGRLEAQRLQRFISAFQSVTPLTIGELWAWPSVLKLALLDHLRMRGDVLAAGRTSRQAADRLAAAIEEGPVSPDGGRRTSIMRSSPACCSAPAPTVPRPRRSIVNSTGCWRRAGSRSRTRSAPRGSTRRPNRRAWRT
jgi:hypothetical protein